MLSCCHLRESTETNGCEEVDGEASVAWVVTWHQTLIEWLQSSV